MKSINQVCEENRETLGSVLGECCLLTGEDGRAARESVQSVFHSMVEEKGVQKAFAKLLPEEAWNKRVQCMRVPDWIYLLFKLKSRISDSGWQDLTNLTKLGRTGKTSDQPIILIKNNIGALRRSPFSVTRMLMNVTSLPAEVPGFEVNMENVAVWVIREMRLHGSLPDGIVFNLKIDGCPFFGKEQVTVGIVPLDSHHQSSQSAKSVYPLVIANCKENREDLRKLLSNLNKQKDKLKKMGIRVDGKHYRVRFKVTLDYKGLVLLMAKVNDDDFLLGGQGLAIEFCIFCLALRACDCDLGKHEVCLEHFIQTKANIGGRCIGPFLCSGNFVFCRETHWAVFRFVARKETFFVEGHKFLFFQGIKEWIQLKYFIGDPQGGTLITRLCLVARLTN